VRRRVQGGGVLQRDGYRSGRWRQFSKVDFIVKQREKGSQIPHFAFGPNMSI
jgi:hypothetical protein